MTGRAEDQPPGAGGASPSGAARLGSCADWRYLLRDFDEIYRRSSAGGSAVIRSHQRRVREALARIVESDPIVTPREAQSRPAVDHLARALDLGEVGPLGAMVRTLRRIAPVLCWEHGYERMPRKLASRYAYAELLGPNGPVVADTLILGLVLFAPDTIYPQHAHSDIEESYVSLSGAWSENDAAVYAPGSFILNRSGQQHRITVGDRAPCLLAYAWIGPPARLAAPGMRFSRSRGA